MGRGEHYIKREYQKKARNFDLGKSNSLSVTYVNMVVLFKLKFQKRLNLEIESRIVVARG